MLEQPNTPSSAPPTRRQFLGALGAGLTLGALDCEPEQTGQRVAADHVSFDVLAGRPTDSSITLNVLPSAKIPWLVEWGAGPADLHQRSEEMPPTLNPTEVVLAGLSSSAKYYYRVRRSGSKAGAEAAVRTFRTRRRPGESFVFTLSTDSHLNAARGPRQPGKPFSLAAQLIRKEEPDFHVTLGDEVMTHSQRLLADTPELAAASYVNYRAHYAPVAGVAPFFFALGNHDGEGWIDESHGHSRQLAEVSCSARQQYMPNPLPSTYRESAGPTGNYFAWTWGDALFIAIDPYTYSTTNAQSPEEWTLGEQQMLWLEGVLVYARQRWKILFQHQLVGGHTGTLGARYFGTYEPYANYGRGGATLARVGEQKQIHELFRRCSGALIFKGHDHLYADETADGIRYTTAGHLMSGSSERVAPWTAFKSFRDLYPAGFVCHPGYVRVEVSPDTLDVRFIDDRAAVQGAYQIHAPGGV